MLLAVLVVAAAVSALCVYAHAMWFDELQAWNLARASHSFPELLRHLRYEGHPPLWYLPLYGLTRFTGDPRVMQVLGWVIAVAVDAVVLFRSPFPVPARIAPVAGYFFVFEYSVITRSYGLGVLLLVVVLAQLGREAPRWGTAALVLALLAWTSLAGAVLACVVADHRVPVVDGWRDGAATRGPITCTLSTLAASGLAAITCIPPSDFHSFSLGIPNSASDYLEPHGSRRRSAARGRARAGARGRRPMEHQRRRPAPG